MKSDDARVVECPPDVLTAARTFTTEFRKEFRSAQAEHEGWAGYVDGFDEREPLDVAYLALVDAIGAAQAGVTLNEQRPDALKDMEARKDAAYEERNRVVAALAFMAIWAGWRAGIARTAIEGWSDDWHGCVYIDFPNGQASWHYHDSHAHLFADLPPYRGSWDGHTTPEKYELLAHVCEVLAAGSAPKMGIPRAVLDHIAEVGVDFAQDGNKVCATFGDHIDLQQSPAGFGENNREALRALVAAWLTECAPEVEIPK